MEKKRGEGKLKVKRKEQMGEEERDRGRERVRRIRETSSYYKWQSLPGHYDKDLSALPGIKIPQ